MKKTSLDIIKLASLYYLQSLAVSESFDIMGKGINIESIIGKIDALNFKSSPFGKAKMLESFYPQILNFILKKFQQLVLPYIDPEKESPAQKEDFVKKYIAVDPTLLHRLNQQEIDRYANQSVNEVRKLLIALHRESISLGSGEDIYKREQDLQPFGSAPSTYSLTSPHFSLKEHIDKSIVGRLSGKKEIVDGLTEYLFNVMTGCANDMFGSQLTGRRLYSGNYPMINIADIPKFSNSVLEQIITDVDNLQDPKYQKIGEDLIRFFNGVSLAAEKNMKHILQASNQPLLNLGSFFEDIIMNSVPWENGKTNLDQREMDDKSLSSRITSKSYRFLNSQPWGWANPNAFGLKDYRKNKPLESMMDESVASLLRRWLRVVDTEVDRLSKEFLNQPKEEDESLDDDIGDVGDIHDYQEKKVIFW